MRNQSHEHVLTQFSQEHFDDQYSTPLGQLEGPYLQEGRQHELRSVLHEQDMPRGSLWIADLGYWTLTWLRSLSQQGVYFLLR